MKVLLAIYDWEPINRNLWFSLVFIDYFALLTDLWETTLSMEVFQ